LLLHLRPVRTDEIAVRHTARTRRLASQAPEAAIDVRLRGGGGQRAFEHLLHEHDAAAGGVHLLAEFLVSRTGGETEAAMHARLHGLGHRLAQRAVLIRFDRVKHQELASVAESEAKPQSASQEVAEHAETGQTESICLCALRALR
jgi:hypothetical protein